ncbi:hypothetical protein M408DRAFT_128319 [Serendipita vermifera MAFF 305830]|uniref:Uncharacterized protein n=1 Tax=Serendipita vermifera MAFF 305830 TaxID=933852 RepID=A0A0C3AX72_SERVB|nr:hypothetical protein M408DRAFT_128319 [Serendipita vermifera MAFF 305830]
MSRDPRPNRSGAGAIPPPRRQYDEFDDEYQPTSRYYSNEIPDNSARGYGSGSRNQGGASGGSLLDRMKVKSYDQSSRTSNDGDYDNRPRQPTTATWARKSAAGAARQQAPEPRREERREVVQAPPDSDSAGNTLWGRVMNATGSLSINIPVGWSNISSDGPETPPGGESRLTKVMKQYYIDRARTPLDLPHWLFEEHERMPTAARQRAPRRYEEPEEEGYISAPAPRGALRDVYDKAARATPTSQQSTRSNQSSYPTSPNSDQAPGESKATSRLRALRDAKRMQQGGGVAASAASSRYDDDYANDGGRRSMEPASDVERRQPARVGLPSRPGGRYN